MAALLTRNDGECHLEYVEEVDVESGMGEVGEMGERGGFGVLNEGGFYQYNRDPEQVRYYCARTIYIYLCVGLGHFGCICMSDSSQPVEVYSLAGRAAGSSVGRAATS